MKRREFLHIIGASSAAAAVGGCARGGGPNTLIPYLIPADDGVMPGVDAEYATVCRECPAGCGMIAKVRDGRVHKVEGNPDHPVNRGKLCLRGHTALQGLYHPDRTAGPLLRNPQTRQLHSTPWPAAEARFDEALKDAASGRVAWVGELQTGTFDDLVDRWLSVIAPVHTRLQYEPLGYEPLRKASERAFGTAQVPHFRLDRAGMILSFGADFVETWISNVEYTRQFSAWRQAREAGIHKERYVFIAPRLSLTGQNADEWISIRPGSEGAMAQALEWVVDAVRQGAAVPLDKIAPLSAAAGVKVETVERLGREFAAANHPLALPPGNAANGPDITTCYDAVMRLNVAAGNVGRTVITDAPHALSAAATHREMMDLIADMRAGHISVLFLHGVNPVYNLPPSAGWAEAVANVKHVISFSSYPDETTGAHGETTGFAHLVLPDRTPLESWGDYAPRPGITGLQQPVVAPVAWTEDGKVQQFDTRPTGDLLLASAARLGHNLGVPTFHQYLRAAYHMDEPTWMETLQRGGVFEAAGPAAAASPLPIGFATSVFDSPNHEASVSSTAQMTVATTPLLAQLPSGQLFLHIYPSLQFFDGRTADRPWAQEIPDATTKAVWGSWVEIHPATAAKLGAKQGTVLVLQTPYGRIEAPALLTRYLHPDTLAVQLGQGHPSMGRYAEGVDRVNPIGLLGNGFEAASGALILSGTAATVKAVAVVRPPVILQTSFSDASTINERSGGIAQSIELSDLNEKKAVGREAPQPSLYHTPSPTQHPDTKHHWGMVIDLDRCVGCNACVAACYSENNVPVVGKEQCDRGREMSWLRIETYTDPVPSPTADPAAEELDIRFLPMLCQQCDNAPCEYVCPVNATMHSDEHLNMQVYNRCVGTRYCSNNCPYKVRRFNWFTFPFPPPLDQQLNPDVIHRKKGVMEKCTFCIQRIRGTEINAGVEKRPIADGEIQTACMQSCPADAIIFGDLEDKNSYVHRHSGRTKRGYGALADLNTYPNITYLERIRASAKK